MHLQEDVPSACPICRKVFIRKELMKDHLRRKHKLYKQSYKSILDNPALMMLSSLAGGAPEEGKRRRVGRPPKKKPAASSTPSPSKTSPAPSTSGGRPLRPIRPRPSEPPAPAITAVTAAFNPNLNAPLSSLLQTNPDLFCQTALVEPSSPPSDPLDPPSILPGKEDDDVSNNE